LDVQKNIFQTIARICLNAPICNRLIFWGISDRYTWLARRAGTDFINPQPLLFDGQFGEKPAFFGVLQALRNAGAGGRQ
jgi:endo-1,4-beta-xylanase